MKKIISIIIAVIMLMTVMTTTMTAFAAENNNVSVGTVTSGTTGNLSWHVSGNTLYINGSGAMPNYSSYSQPWYDCKSIITSIDIGDSVTSIGDYAFYNFANIQSGYLGKGIKSIGKYAFAYMSFETLEIPSACTQISSDAFSYNKNLISVKSSAATKIGEYAFYGCDYLQTVSMPKAKLVEKYAFSGCKNIKTVNLESAVLNSYVFGSSNTSLTSLRCGSVKADAVWYCEGLQTVVMPKATSIGKYGFYKCKNLKSVSSNAKSVGSYAFRGCNALKTVNLPKVTTINDYAFGGDEKLQTVKLGKVQSIGKYAFSDCTALKTVTGTSNLKKVYDGAFSMDRNLEKFGSAKKIQYFGDSAFGDCRKLTGSFGFSNTTVVERMAFANCQKLTSTLNFTKVTKIGRSAFLNCKNIKGNTLGTKIKDLGSTAFVGCKKINQLYVPGCCKTIGYDVFPKQITSLSVSEYGSISYNYNSKGAKIAICGVKNSQAQKYAKTYSNKFRYAVTSISTNKKAYTVKKGRTFKMKIYLKPGNVANRGVTISTSNKKIASVGKNGVIKGVKKGKCTITIKAKDGSLKTKKVTVTVK